MSTIGRPAFVLGPGHQYSALHEFVVAIALGAQEAEYKALLKAQEAAIAALKEGEPMGGAQTAAIEALKVSFYIAAIWCVHPLAKYVYDNEAYSPPMHPAFLLSIEQCSLNTERAGHAVLS